MEYSASDEENKSLNEPASSYGSLAGKKVRIFNSFQEQEEEMVAYWASISPLQRLTHLYEMIKISFRITEKEARHIQSNRKIHIIRYEP